MWLSPKKCSQGRAKDVPLPLVPLLLRDAGGGLCGWRMVCGTGGTVLIFVEHSGSCTCGSSANYHFEALGYAGLCLPRLEKANKYD